MKYQICNDDSSYTLHNHNDDGDVATLTALTESWCANDFIVIEGSSSTCSTTNTVNRYCGEKFSDVDMQAQDLQICGNLKTYFWRCFIVGIILRGVYKIFFFDRLYTTFSSNNCNR